MYTIKHQINFQYFLFQMGPSVPSTVEDLLNNDVQLQNEGQMVVP